MKLLDDYQTMPGKRSRALTGIDSAVQPTLHRLNGSPAIKNAPECSRGDQYTIGRTLGD
ncbi:hypothetical protein AB0J83_10980 [Actinoplanes sp. NPDC049596]|uniref:hypothetical protein n=1 Tax=unclassified Actinoplanes TaxID=2626549 RepID=UPI00342D7B31